MEVGSTLFKKNQRSGIYLITSSTYFVGKCRKLEHLVGVSVFVCIYKEQTSSKMLENGKLFNPYYPLIKMYCTLISHCLRTYLYLCSIQIKFTPINFRNMRAIGSSNDFRNYPEKNCPITWNFK